VALSLESFEDALARVEGKPKALLGNGFSIAWSAETFSYPNLRASADFSKLSCDASGLFDALRTADFEVVIDRLEAAYAVASLYDGDSAIAERARQDAEVIRDALAGALAASHPDHVGCVAAGSYASARQFLANFEAIYSLNYDLLLYWATMHDPEDGLDVPRRDGFDTDPDDEDAPWVTWDMGNAWKQDIHYLHGALHLFDAGDRIKKLTWIRTDRRILDQIREQLANRVYPLVVTEGSSADKLTKILHSAYLSKAFRSFLEKGGDLFIYGHSLAETDDHILDALASNKFERIFIGVYGDPGTPTNRLLMERGSLLPDRRRRYVEDSDPRRRKGRELTVRFFDAGSANVWGTDGDTITKA
jgi:hypothetical protein